MSTRQNPRALHEEVHDPHQRVERGVHVRAVRERRAHHAHLVNRESRPGVETEDRVVGHVLDPSPEREGLLVGEVLAALELRELDTGGVRDLGQ